MHGGEGASTRCGGLHGTSCCPPPPQQPIQAAPARAQASPHLHAAPSSRDVEMQQVQQRGAPAAVAARHQGQAASGHVQAGGKQHVAGAAPVAVVHVSAPHAARPALGRQAARPVGPPPVRGEVGGCGACDDGHTPREALKRRKRKGQVQAGARQGAPRPCLRPSHTSRACGKGARGAGGPGRRRRPPRRVLALQVLEHRGLAAPRQLPAHVQVDHVLQAAVGGVEAGDALAQRGVALLHDSRVPQQRVDGAHVDGARQQAGAAHPQEADCAR